MLVKISIKICTYHFKSLNFLNAYLSIVYTSSASQTLNRNVTMLLGIELAEFIPESTFLKHFRGFLYHHHSWYKYNLFLRKYFWRFDLYLRQGNNLHLQQQQLSILCSNLSCFCQISGATFTPICTKQSCLTLWLESLDFIPAYFLKHFPEATVESTLWKILPTALMFWHGINKYCRGYNTCCHGNYTRWHCRILNIRSKSYHLPQEVLIQSLSSEYFQSFMLFLSRPPFVSFLIKHVMKLLIVYLNEKNLNDLVMTVIIIQYVNKQYNSLCQ